MTTNWFQTIICSIHCVPFIANYWRARILRPFKKKFWHFSTTNATFLISRAKIVGTRKQQKRLRLHNCDSIFDGSITARGIMVLVPDIAIYRAHNIKMSHILGIIEAVGEKKFPYPFSHGVSISIEKLGQHGGKNKS